MLRGLGTALRGTASGSQRHGAGEGLLGEVTGVLQGPVDLIGRPQKPRIGVNTPGRTRGANVR